MCFQNISVYEVAYHYSSCFSKLQEIENREYYKFVIILNIMLFYINLNQALQKINDNLN